MNPTMTDPRAWLEVRPDYINTADQRTPENYLRAIKQFDVEKNPRYARGHDNNPANGQETYCNIYLWDVTKALACEIPHWVYPSTGPETFRGTKKELSANGVYDWLAWHGADAGWRTCAELAARSRASSGYPTVVLWKNPKGIGHVGIVLPGTDYTHITQAGAVNFFDKSLIKGFGNVKPLLFYTHD